MVRKAWEAKCTTQKGRNRRKKSGQTGQCESGQSGQSGQLPTFFNSLDLHQFMLKLKSEAWVVVPYTRANSCTTHNVGNVSQKSGQKWAMRKVGHFSQNSNFVNSDPISDFLASEKLYDPTLSIVPLGMSILESECSTKMPKSKPKSHFSQKPRRVRTRMIAGAYVYNRRWDHSTWYLPAKNLQSPPLSAMMDGAERSVFVQHSTSACRADGNMELEATSRRDVVPA